mgnify:CR=1 FL=1
MEEGKAYIESGILELYVLGHLNPEECVEVEAMSAKHPEVRKEINAIEFAMEQYALSQAVEPSEGLDQRILKQIEASKDDYLTANHRNATETILLKQPLAIDNRVRNLRFALAACIALLVASSAALYSVYSELGSARDRIADLNAQKEQFTATVNYMKQANSDLQKIADMGEDPNWKIVRLAGTPMDPKAKMVVYWHTSGRHVMLDNSKMDLPVNDELHQYQLWALVNGKPVDLGVFDVKADTASILVNMKDIANAQTFAVTLEKRGGQPAPTMDQMIVAGNVSI